MDPTAKPETTMTGIEKARALMAGARRPGIGETLDFKLVAVEDGFAACEGLPGPHAYNPLGVVHGGYAATLLDSVCGFAVLSKLTPEQSFTTIELKIAYHKAMTAKTGLVRAEGRVVSIGRRVAFCEARLADAEGRLCASATSSLLILSA